MGFRLPRYVHVATLTLFCTACSPSLTEEELTARAARSLAAGDVAAAEIDVKTALQQNPDNPAARSIYGQIYLQQINPEAAVDEFERALAAIESPDTRLWLAKALVHAGESAELVSDFEAGFYDNVADNSEFQAGLARAYLSQTQFDLARDALSVKDGERGNDYIDITKAVFALELDQDVKTAESLLQSVADRNPGNAHAWSLLGVLASRREDRVAAEEYFANASSANPYRLGDRLQLVTTQIRMGKGDVAAVDLAQLEKLIPNYPEVNFLRGQLFFDSGEYENALGAFSRVLTVNPNHLGALLLSANANAREQNLVTSQRQYTQFLTQQPGHLKASLQLAEVWRLLGEPENTEAVARGILEEHEMNIRALSLLAAALSAQGMHADSAQIYDEIMALQPDSVQAQVAAGSQKLVSGDTDAGLAQLEAAVALDPASSGARERLIEARLAVGDISGAEEAAEEYLKLAPDAPRASIYLGRVRLQQQNYDDAITLLDRALELDPGNIEASGSLAALAVLNNDLDGARANFEGALEANPGDLATSMNLALVLEQSGDIDTMRSVLAEAVESNPDAVAPRIPLARYALSQNQPGDAIELMRAVEESSEDDFRVHQILTASYLSLGEVDSARNSGRRLLMLRAEDPRALALVARVEVASGRPAVAQQHIEKALETLPESGELRKQYIEVLMTQRKLGQAGEQIALLPEAAQNETPVLVLRGRLAMADGDVVRAEVFFRQAFEQQRSSINLALMTEAQWRGGKSDEVLLAYASWLEEYSDDGLIRNELASRLLETGDETAARAQYELLVAQQPENVLVLNNLAWLSRATDTEAALEYIERADSLAPGSGDIKDTYAMVVLETGDIDRALALNSKALEAAPENMEMRYNRAQILATGGRTEDAAELLTELIAGPVFPSMDAARELLDSL